MPDSALIYNELALKKFPDSRELVYNKAQILENVGALDSATKVYKRFLVLEPDRYDVLEKVGDIYFRKKNYAAAFLVYDKWGKAQPEQTKAFLKAAGCYEVQKKFADAKNYLERIRTDLPEEVKIKSEIDRLTYILDAQENRYYDYGESYKSASRAGRNKTVEEPEENRRIFDEKIGTIEKIQKRSQLNLGRDTTRH
jgi:tetratricopeptide (TPR) repeat protein